VSVFTFPGELNHAQVHRSRHSKRVFQLHTVDPETVEIERRQLTRAQLLEHFVKLSPAIIAMEACSASQHWARRFAAVGHEVRLIATKFVRPFVKTNKTDAADAAGIWEAAQRPGMRFVPVKTEQQQEHWRFTTCAICS
jgi:transposase